MTSEIILSSIALIIAFLVLCLYKCNKLNAIEAYLIGFSTQAFYLEFIGPTISTLFLIALYFAFEDLLLIIRNGYDVRLKHHNIILITLPIASFIICYIYYISNDNIFDSKLDLSYIKSFIVYYLKNYLIFFAIGWRVSKEVRKCDFTRCFNILEAIAMTSCLIALFQLLFHGIIGHMSAVIPTSHGEYGYILDLIVGLKSYSYTFNNIHLTRPNAFFFEPKELAGFLAIIIPYMLYKKKYLRAVLASAVGVITSSSTFYIILIIAAINFVLLKRIRYIRTTVLMNIFIMITFAFFVTNTAELILDKYGTYSDKLIYMLLFERSVSRLDTSRGIGLQDERKDFYGIPLQRDMELPVVNFMRDNPIVFLIGYGPGNARSVPNNYFIGTNVYEQKLTGVHVGHMNMGWLYYVAEMGVLNFIISFIILTRININGISLKYYSFIVSSLFVYRVDILLVIMYVILSNSKYVLTK